LSKAPTNFKQTDLTRALRGALAAGLVPIAIDVDSKAGKFFIQLKNGPGDGCHDKAETAAEAITGG